MIGFIGGIVGVGLSYLITLVVTSSAFGSAATGGGMRNTGMNSIMSLNFSLPLSVIIMGVVFTTLVGILSGYIPARKSNGLQCA